MGLDRCVRQLTKTIKKYGIQSRILLPYKDICPDYTKLYIPSKETTSLIWLSSGLAGFLFRVSQLHRILKHHLTYQLIQIPSAYGHVTLVIIHTFAEILNIGCTSGVLPRSIRSSTLVETRVHRLSLSGRSSLLVFGGSATAATAE